MNRGKHVVAYQTLGEHDGILVVVTLPRHVSHEQVATQGKLAILSGIALGQDVTLRHTLSLLAERTQVDGHILVGTAELRNAVFLQSGLEADKLLVLSAIVEDADGGSIDVLDDTVALGNDHRT